VLVLIVALLCGLAAGYALGGRLRNLERLDLRLPWLVILAMGIQLVIFTSLGDAVGETASLGAHAVSYALLLAFALLNRRNLGVLLAGVGTALNATVIIANGGYMPASRSALELAGLFTGETTHNNSVVADHGARLLPLGDVMAVPGGVPFVSNVFSVGDLFIAVGVALLLATAMRASARVTGVQTAGTR
jgi:hypothetical protein